MGSCVSVCGKCVEAAEVGYAVVSTALPWLKLPDGRSPQSDGVLIVQIIRDKDRLPNVPRCTLQNEEMVAQMHNISGDSEGEGDLPKQLVSEKTAALDREQAGGSENAAHSFMMLVLLKDVDVSHTTLVVDFGHIPNEEPGPNAGTFKLPLSDSTVVLSSSTAMAFSPGESDGAATYHKHRVGVDGPEFAMSVVRYNVFANERYPYNRQSLQALIEGTRNSDFNPYPKPLNHITDGTLWVNWGLTLASKPTRIYSDGAILPGESTARYPSPRSLEDVQGLVAFAREKQLNVRVFGANHSWAPLSSTGGVLVDNRMLNTVKPVAGFDPLGNGRSWPGYCMTLNKHDPDANGEPTVYFPPGISTGDLERWIQLHGGYRMPTSTVEDVFTMGGILATACHGTGKLNPSMSDWVVAMEFVDWNGKLQRISRTQCPAEYLTEVQLDPSDPNSVVKLEPEDVYRAMLCNLGAFGVIWSYTMRVYPPAPVYLIAKTMPWKELFDDTDEARENLAALQAKHDTFEVFYFPFKFTGRLFPVYDTNPNVYVWLGDTKPPEGVEVYEPTDEECFGQDLMQHIGVNMLHKAFLNAAAEPALYAMMPYLASMMELNLLLTVNPKGQPCAWKIPQWRSSHPFNAIGSVEAIRCVDIEWTMKCNVKQGGAGIMAANRSYGDLIRGIHAAFHSSSNPFDMHRFPVTITAEMRIFHGSGALMSPQYTEVFDVDDVSSGDCYCAPEIVSHAGNAGWDRFYAEMNTHMIDPANSERYGSTVRVHQAKEFAVLPGQLAFLRRSYRSEKYKSADPFSYFCRIRDVIDPNRMFVNPFLHQFLYTEEATYVPPKELPVFTRGQIQELDPNHLEP